MHYSPLDAYLAEIHFHQYFHYGEMVKNLGNCFQIRLIIYYTADWSYSLVQFLDVNATLKDGYVITGFCVKPADTCQCLYSSSFHPYHCKNVSLKNKVCVLVQFVLIMFFYQGYFVLRKWLHAQRYSERCVRQQISSARKKKRNELPDRDPYHL